MRCVFTRQSVGISGRPLATTHAQRAYRVLVLVGSKPMRACSPPLVPEPATCAALGQKRMRAEPCSCRQNAIVAIRNARCRPRFCHSVPLVQDPATKPVPHVQQLLGLDSVRPWSNLVCTDGVSSHVRVHIGASASACCSHVCIRISAVSLQGELEGKVEKTHGLERLLLPGASHHDAPRQNR
ncbi:unnamed protein product [Clonostachys rosea f. rosea IK726]|uniref:Uncharacterized protein n=1 Tax=Clonostachys rosea f. rosea IK726 TaxID=1349383 RepID=A0ACA9TV92_BIOOC|nr:unnamed protein product [Clonostachys rosea f. rosea IK726]